MAPPGVDSRMFIHLTLFAIFTKFGAVDCRYTNEAEFSIKVSGNQQQCFFQEVKKDQYLEVEYQVLDAHFDSLNIDFSVKTSEGKSLVLETGKSEAVHRVSIPSDSVVEVCLDNRNYSSRKTVYVELYVEEPDFEDEHADDDDPFDLGPITLAPDAQFNSTQIDQMRHRLSRIYESLNQIERYQEWQKAHEARHRSLVEKLFTILNMMSGLQTSLIFLILFIQVRVIEKFFLPESFSVARKIIS